MHQFVQSAINAAQQGNKNKAMEFLKQALAANPNDTDAMLVLAGIVDQPERKRQVLERVLKLDPINKVAREELVELDRLAMLNFIDGLNASVAPQPESTTLPPTISHSESREPTVPARSESLTSSPVQHSPQPISASQSQMDSKLRIDKPLVFKYPSSWRIAFFVLAALFGCSGLLIASQSFTSSLPALVLALLFGLTAFSNSARVEISDTEIGISSLFSSAKIKWNDIASIKPNVLKKKLELSSSTGQLVNISTQVKGYPAIVEVLRQKRPDLFTPTPRASATEYGQSPSSSQAGSNLTSGFAETRIFKRNFFAQYGAPLLMLPICLVGAWAAITMTDKFVGISIGLVGLFFMAVSLFATNQIKVEPNKLTTESFFNQKELTAKQIKEINMQTVRGRRGVATNFIKIQPIEGSAISLAGFPEGDEILYGILMNWWNTYRN